MTELPSFDAGTDADSTPSCTFLIPGVEGEFTCKSGEDIPTGFMRRVLTFEDDAVSLAGDKIEEFFTEVLMPADVPRFKTEVLDKFGEADGPRLSPKALNRLLQFLLGHVLGFFPAPAPSNSSAGRTRTGRKSSAGSSSRATRRKAS